MTLVEWCTSLGFQYDVPHGDSLGQEKAIVFGDRHSGVKDTRDADAEVKVECDDAGNTDDGVEVSIPSPADCDVDDGSIPEKNIDVKLEIAVESVASKRASGKTRFKQKFACPLCQKTFTQKHWFERHQANCRVVGHLNGGDDVKVPAPNLRSRQSHQKEGKKEYACEVCGECFRWPGSLWKHWKSHPDWKPYRCKVCAECFATSKELKQHRQAAHNGRLQCQQCGKVLTTVGKFTEHMKRHANAREYICCICAARFNTKSQLTQHETLHLGLKPFKCDLCPKACSSQRHLDEHKLSHSKEKLYSCQYCGKRQKYMSGLRIHEKLHTQGRTCKCQTCGKTFATTSQLKQHSVTHTGEKRHKCSVCGQCFTGPSAKRRHEFAHTGLKPFPCSRCGKMFADKRDVREHEKIHAVEKPEQCQQCGKCFHTAGGLNAHRKTHQTNERELYYCSVCSKSFMRSHNRNIHEVNVHGLPRRKRHTVPVITAMNSPANDITAFVPQEQEQQQEQHLGSIEIRQTGTHIVHNQLVDIPLYATIGTSQYVQNNEQM